MPAVTLGTIGGWLGYGAVILLCGALLWIPLAAWSDFVLSPVLRDLIESGALFMTEGQFRLTIIKAGLKGMALIALLATALSAVTPNAPAWVIGLIGFALGVVVSAFFMPPDIVTQLAWVCCVVAAMLTGCLLQRRRKAARASV